MTKRAKDFIKRFNFPLDLSWECAVAGAFLFSGYAEAYMCIVASIVLGLWLHEHGPHLFG